MQGLPDWTACCTYYIAWINTIGEGQCFWTHLLLRDRRLAWPMSPSRAEGSVWFHRGTRSVWSPGLRSEHINKLELRTKCCSDWSECHKVGWCSLLCTKAHWCRSKSAVGHRSEKGLTPHRWTSHWHITIQLNGTGLSSSCLVLLFTMTLQFKKHSWTQELSWFLSSRVTDSVHCSDLTYSTAWFLGYNFFCRDFKKGYGGQCWIPECSKKNQVRIWFLSLVLEVCTEYWSDMSHHLRYKIQRTSCCITPWNTHMHIRSPTQYDTV